MTESQPFGVAPKQAGMWAVNAGDSVNRYLNIGERNTMTETMNEQLNKMFKSAQETADRSTQAMEEYKTWFNAIKTPTPPIMTRLTTHNDWTILLENEKLLAVDSKGNTIRAVGSLLSAGGKAWMWIHGQLWSGELELTLTERMKKIQETAIKKTAVYNKYDKQLAKLDTKLTKEENKRRKLIKAREEEICSVSE